jgi:hexosaminidase
MKLAVAAAALVSAASALETSDPTFAILPPPRSIQLSGGPLRLADNFQFRLSAAEDAAGLSGEAAARLSRGMARYNSIVGTLTSGPMTVAPAKKASSSLPSSTCALSGVDVRVTTPDSHLDMSTDYSYIVLIDGEGSCTAEIVAPTLYGALYGMESVTQLLVPAASSRTYAPFLQASRVAIEDSPKFAWRGIMIDSGRRFFPVPVVENFLDTMAAAKMSVLHLHASDMCRFGVESKLYPNLTAALTGDYAGFYSQADIASLISYGADRGIRVVPEFDVPGHSRGFIPIEGNGVVFCLPDDPTRSQIYGDPANSTLGVLKSLFTEMAGLFTDSVFDIGSDETSALGPCTVDSTFALEREILDYIADSLNKTPAGWEEVLFDAGAATQGTIVYSWARHWPPEITATGRVAVASNDSHLYFTSPAPGGPDGWAPCWFDIGDGVPSDQMSLLAGGEASMWTDTYCITEQCGAFNGPTPVASALFPPQMDAEFAASIGGMVFPRGLVAASAFWNYNSSVSPYDPGFVSSVWALNTQLQQRGALVCPTNCSCDQLSACGVPYIKPTPPSFGTPISAGVCQPGIGVEQRWAFNPDGTVAMAANATLCLHDPGEGVYPLTLGLCGASNGAAVWKHDPTTSELIQTATGACMDLRESDSAIGTYQCGSGQGLKQANQEWAVDQASGVVLSLLNGYCVSANATW